MLLLEPPSLHVLLPNSPSLTSSPLTFPTMINVIIIMMITMITLITVMINMITMITVMITIMITVMITNLPDPNLPFITRGYVEGA